MRESRGFSGPNEVLLCKAGSAARTAMAVTLCVLLANQPLLDASVPKRGPSAGVQPMKGESRVEHALNRLTFGPRPGDVAAVQAVGLSTWFENQLNPGKIDDSALQARLAQFPAMQMPQAELIARFPSQQAIRQMERTGSGLPTDPVERAIYADEMAFYRAQKARQAAKATEATGVADGTAGTALTTRRKATPEGSGNMAAGVVTEASPVNGSEAMTAGPNTPSPDEAAAMLKQDLSDSQSAPAEHVEQLFKDLEATKIISLPPEERMHKVIGMQPDEFVAFRQSLSGRELGQFVQGLNPQQKEIFAAMQNGTRMVASEEMQARLVRDIYSDRQLEAVMTDFWLNHFNVYVRKNQNEAFLIPAYERDVIRPNALGKFEDLLVATAKSPAMLMYLDNWQSVGPDSPAARQAPRFARLAQNPQVKAALKDRGLNENYGRELMELHTVGVNGGYSQKDVTEVAKVFTGWTVEPPYGRGAGSGMPFQFDERRHEPGPKTVMGQTIKENGMDEGLEVLHMLATSPATAKFISTKLAVRFVSDDPPSSLIDKMSQAFLHSSGDIKTVLRAMFEAPEFWAPAVERAKVKTPLEFVVSAVRVSGAQVNTAQSLVTALDKLGMPLYGMQTPNGYSWMSEPWVSTGALVSRMNFALVLTGDKLPGVRTEWTKLLGEPGGARHAVAMDTGDGSGDPEVAAKERKLEQILLVEPLSEKTRAALLNHSNDETAAQAVKDFQGGGGGKGEALGPLALAAAMAGNGAGARNAPDDPQAAVLAGLMLGSPEFQRR